MQSDFLETGEEYILKANPYLSLGWCLQKGIPLQPLPVP